MSEQKSVDYHEESPSEKLARKTKEFPFVVTAIGGLLGIAAYGAYGYKNRGNMSPSVYFMQYRVIAQGTAVGILSAGMVYMLYKNYVNKPKENTAAGVSKK